MKYKKIFLVILFLTLSLVFIYSVKKISFLSKEKREVKEEIKDKKEIKKEEKLEKNIEIKQERQIENKIKEVKEQEETKIINGLPNISNVLSISEKPIVNKKNIENKEEKKNDKKTLQKEDIKEEKPNKKEEIKEEVKPVVNKPVIPPVTVKKEVLAKLATKTTYIKDNEEITTLWVRGITPPNINEFTKEVHNDYLIQTIPYSYNKGWFDVNKSGDGYSDRVLCSGAVASNMLHWWLLQNKTYIDKYLTLNPTKAKLSNDNNVWKDLNHYLGSYQNQNSSKIFDMFKLYYGNTNGIWADTSVDFFINGYKASLTGATNRSEKFERDDKGGFFYDVFKTNILTNRFFSGSYEDFSEAIKLELQNGHIIGLGHRTPSKKSNHIVTLWGADFNSQGKIIGVYVTDSDDYTESNVAMRRLNVNNKDSKPVITSSINKNVGINLEYIHTLSLGREYWEAFFK